VAGTLADDRDLGIHAEFLADGIRRLIEGGAATGALKCRERFQAVTTDSFGSPDMYPFLDENRHVQLWPVEETNHEPTIAMQAKFCAVNATMQVDLLGQCASETLGSHYISGSGGQPTSCAAPRCPTEGSRSS
jgi:acyl-CoA hydrolase